MSHVDDGELTAFADGAYPVNDPDALRISAHLSACNNCRTRLEQAQLLRDRATEILGYATPATRTPPSFETLQAQVATTSQPRRRHLNLAWAASIMLALGLGWYGRGAWQNPPEMRSGAVLDAPAAARAVQPEEVAAVPPPQVAAPQVTTETRDAKREEVRNQQADAVANMSARPAGEPAMGALAGAGNTTAAVAPPAAPAIAEADFVGQGARAVGYITAAEAERRGITVPRIPELPIARIGLGENNTIVEQTLPDGKVVRFTITDDLLADAERRELKAPAPAAARVRAAQSEMAQVQKTVVQDVTIRQNGRLITITGDLPPDSLRALAQKIR